MGQGQPFRLSPRPASWSCLLLIVEAVRNISLPIHAVAILSRSKSISGGFKSFPEGTIPFFPRASERRVLLKVEVCYTSSHVHILTSSHLHIFTNSLLHIFTSSYLHILTSSHLLVFLASHPHIFTHLHTSSHSLTHLHTSSLSLSPSLSLLPSVTVSLLLFFSLLRPQAVPTRRHNMTTLSREMRFESKVKS